MHETENTDSDEKLAPIIKGYLHEAKALAAIADEGFLEDLASNHDKVSENIQKKMELAGYSRLSRTISK